MHKRLMLVLPLLMAACTPWQDRDNSAEESVAAISRAMEDQKCPLEGCFWLEVQGQEGDWIKVGLFFGFLGNREVCEEIAAELTTPEIPEGYPILERIYRCNKMKSKA